MDTNIDWYGTAGVPFKPERLLSRLSEKAEIEAALLARLESERWSAIVHARCAWMRGRRRSRTATKADRAAIADYLARVPVPPVWCD